MRSPVESDASSMPGLVSVSTHAAPASGDKVEVERTLNRIFKEIQVISNKIRKDQEDKVVSAKWKYAAMVSKENLS